MWCRVLLDNVIKFWGEDKDTKVDVKATAQDITLTVMDRRQGFSPDWAPELFRPFTAANMTHHSQGTGLNLTLACAIVEVYGGQLWGESEGVRLGAALTAVFAVVSVQQANNTGYDLD